MAGIKIATGSAIAMSAFNKLLNHKEPCGFDGTSFGSISFQNMNRTHWHSARDFPKKLTVRNGQAATHEDSHSRVYGIKEVMINM